MHTLADVACNEVVPKLPKSSSKNLPNSLLPVPLPPSVGFTHFTSMKYLSWNLIEVPRDEYMCGFLLIKVPGDIPLNQCHNSRYIFGQAHNVFQDGNLTELQEQKSKSCFCILMSIMFSDKLNHLKSQVTHGRIERMLRTVWKSGLLFLSRNALEWLFKILQGLQGKPTTYRLTWHSGTGTWFHYVKKNHAQLGVVFPCLSPQPSHSLGQDIISKPWVIVKGLMWFYLSRWSCLLLFQVHIPLICPEAAHILENYVEENHGRPDCSQNMSSADL